MMCSNCSFENPSGMKFCGNCAAPLELHCPSCGFQNPPEFKFCGNCGAKIVDHSYTVSQPETKPGLKEKPEAERRHLTVMFCDLVGSTALSTELDPEDLRAIITEYQGICQKVVARYEGHIAQYLGDGILVYFGYPVAHENDAHRAVSSGLGIIEAVDLYNKHPEESGDIHIAVRIGIHTGHVVIGGIGSTGHSQQLALGATPNIAARLEGLAEPGTLIISAATYNIIQRYFLCHPKGQHQVKGIRNPVEIYQVLHENVARSRFENTQSGTDLGPIVGRDGEIERLAHLWEDAKLGKSNVVLVSGEPGVGKSRILKAIMAHVATGSDAWLNIHQCSPYHKGTAYHPLTEVIEHVVLRLSSDETPEEKIHKLEGFLIQYGFSLEEMVPLFAGIMAIPLGGTSYQTTPFSAEQQKQKIIGAFITMYLKRSRRQNLLLVFEDIQWMDPYSLEVINQLINQQPSMNILTVLTFRPEFSPPWRMQPHIIPMALSNLPREAVKEIIGEIAKGKQLPEKLIEEIIQKTDGIPLFVEELTKMVLESEMVKEYEDHFELSGPLSSLAIPSTLHDSLVARLDKMSHTKVIAQLGATIGREFSYEMIKAVSDMGEKAIDHCLNELVDAKLLLQRGVPPTATFQFRHALIRDAAYQSLLKSQQRIFHQRIAQSLIEHMHPLTQSNPEIAAYHFEKAGLFYEAITYWTAAGDRVRQHLAYDQALGYIQRGLDLIHQIKEHEDYSKLELKLLIIQAPVLIMKEGFVSIKAYHSSCRMKELAEQQGDDMSLFRALRGVTTFELFAGKTKKAHNYAKKALEIAKSLGDNDALMEAYRLIGQTSIYAGELTLSLKSFDKALSLHKDAGTETITRLIGVDPGIFSLIQSSHVAWYLGYPDQALRRSQQATKKAEEMKNSYSQVLCNFISSLVNTYCGRMDDAFKYAKCCIELSEEYGIAMFDKEAKIYLAAIMAQKNNNSEELEIIREIIDKRIENGLLAGVYLHISVLANACLVSEMPEMGLEIVNRAIALRDISDDQLFLTEIYRLKAELLSAKNKKEHLAEIENCLNTSIQLAKKQNAKSLELRTAMSIAHLRKFQGRSSEGLELIATVYNWFKEGFETKDLVQVKKLIEKLSEPASTK